MVEAEEGTTKAGNHNNDQNSHIREVEAVIPLIHVESVPSICSGNHEVGNEVPQFCVFQGLFGQ